MKSVIMKCSECGMRVEVSQKKIKPIHEFKCKNVRGYGDCLRVKAMVSDAYRKLRSVRKGSPE
jgi:hypothetical protein